MKKHSNSVILILTCFIMSSMTGIVSSETPLSALIEPESDGSLDRSSLVSYSADGNLIAIGYEDRKEVYLYHSITREELDISPIVLNDEVRSIEFSEDSSNQGSGYLLVGRESELTNTPAVSIYSLSNWGHTWTEDGASITSIITFQSSGYDSFAYATRSGNNEFIIQYSFSDVENHIIKFKTGHNSKISCLDYDPINNMYISGSNEKVELYSGEGALIEEINEIGMDIYDCKFSKEGNYAWSSQDGVKIRDSNHNFLQSYSFQDSISAKKIIFDDVQDRMYLLTNEEGHQLLTYETNNSWDIIEKLIIGHSTNDLDINPVNGDVAVTTNSQFLAIYATEWTDPRYSETAVDDLDHDGISDQEDEDRDGDGILNSYDVNCESTNPCNLVPDSNYLRNIEIRIQEDNLILSESIFLTSDYSESLRLITSETINENGYIEPQERVYIENAFCSKLEPSNIFETWYPVFNFENNSLLAGSSSFSYSCKGFENLNHDSSDRIRFSWEMTFKLAHNNGNSYNLTVNSPPNLDYGMPSNLVHDYPIYLKVSGDDIKSYIVETWFDTTLPFTLEFSRDIEEPAIEINTVINILKYGSFVLVTLSVIVIIVLVISRYKNRFKIEDYSPEIKRSPPSANVEQKVRKSPPVSKRNISKEYDYYNPGRRNKNDWNYGDDGGFYYSETYTDYKKASDSVDDTVKVRKVKVERNPEVNSEEPKQNKRRRVIRKKEVKSNENIGEDKLVGSNNVPDELIQKENIKTQIQDKKLDDIDNSKSTNDLMELMIEKSTSVNKDASSEDEMMDRALDKFLKK